MLVVVYAVIHGKDKVNKDEYIIELTIRKGLHIWVVFYVRNAAAECYSSIIIRSRSLRTTKALPLSTSSYLIDRIV